MGGDARRSGHRGVQLLVDDVLHHGVDGRAVDEAHGPGADASAVPGVVLRGEDDPVIQFELTEAHPEVVQGAVRRRELGAREELGQLRVQAFVTWLAFWSLPPPSPLEPTPLLLKCAR